MQQVVWHQTRCKHFLFFCLLTSRNNVTNALAQINKTIASSPFHCRCSWAARVGAIDAKYMSRNENKYANICKPCLCSPPIKKPCRTHNLFLPICHAVHFETKCVVFEKPLVVSGPGVASYIPMRDTYNTGFCMNRSVAQLSSPTGTSDRLLTHGVPTIFRHTHSQQANKFHVSDLRRQHALNSVDYINRSN